MTAPRHPRGASGRPVASPADAELAAFAESIELAVAEWYEARAESLWDDATTEVLQSGAHHREHAEVFGALAGDRATGKANPALAAELEPSTGGGAEGGDPDGATDGAATTMTDAEVVGAMLAIERRLAATYASMAGSLADATSAGVFASVLMTEADHVVRFQRVVGDPFETWFPAGGIQPVDDPAPFDPVGYPIR